ncbi:MAG: hypothetical protein U0354_07355 [Candidatus Sericytochromatia bacterium]
MLKIFSLGLFSFILVSCTTYKPIMNQDNMLLNNSTINQSNNVEIIPIMEMEDIPELNIFKTNKDISILKEDMITSLNEYKAKILSTDFIKLSKWAKAQMVNYKLKEDIFNKLTVEQVYSFNTSKLIKIKIDNLPSHSPLVIRELYIYNLFDEQNKLKKIYITIQGHVEE